MHIYERGKRNALVIEKREISFYFPDLPPAFDGYKVLFLTDLHLDCLDGLTEKIVEIVRQTSSDLCILGGDFRMRTYGSFTAALDEMGRLLPEIRAKDGILGVLGNHDCLEMVESFKERGVSLLINDSRAVERDGERIWIVGVDDCHYFKAHDLKSAFTGLPLQTFSILVSHSNEVYREAVEYRPDLLISGHTHAGQILLPGIGPVFTHSKPQGGFAMGDGNMKGCRAIRAPGPVFQACP